MEIISRDKYVKLEYRLRLQSGEYLRGSAAAGYRNSLVLPGSYVRSSGSKSLRYSSRANRSVIPAT